MSKRRIFYDENGVEVTSFVWTGEQPPEITQDQLDEIDPQEGMKYRVEGIGEVVYRGGDWRTLTDSGTFIESTEKTTFDDADSFIRSDSEDDSIIKRFSWANLKTAITDFLGIETGDFTPSYGTTGTAFDSVTHNIQEGTYVKVWSVYFCIGLIRTNSLTVGSASGSVVINGMPATSINTGSLWSIATVLRAVSFGSAPMFCGIETNESYIFLQKRSTATSNESSLIPSDMGTGSNANWLRFGAIIIT